MAGRRFRRIGAALVTVAGLAVIVALATGEVALVTTHGISMEPRFHTGDLAVIVPSSRYHIGEIVGYHSPLLHIVVLHRIVAEHSGLFTFKGDNNSFLDPVRLPASAIKGRLWLHIARGGIVLGWLRSPVVLGLLAFFVISLGVGGASRRRRAQGPGSRAGNGSGTERAAPGTVGVAWWPVVVALALVGVFGFVTLVSWTRPTTRPSGSSLAYNQSASFSYTGPAPTGITYPTGRVRTGGPVFLQLVDTLDVGVHYTLAPGASADGTVSTVRGTIGATATVVGPGGWTQPLATVAPVVFIGGSATADVTLDLAQIPALEKAFLAETGLSLDDPEIVVTPVVHVRATMGDTQVGDTFAPTLAFRDEGDVLDVLGTSAGGSAAVSPALTVDRSGSVTRRTLVPDRLSLLGRSATVAVTRRLGLSGLILSILAVIGACIWLMRRRRMDETARIHAAYGHDLVAVSASPTAKAPLVVDVASFDELARLARRYDCVILEHAHVAGHAYYVESGTTLYRCGTESGEPTLVSVDDPDDRATVSVLSPPTDEGVVVVTDERADRGARRRLRSVPSLTDPDMAKIADDVDLLTRLARAEWVSGVGDAGTHLRDAVILARKAGLDEAMIGALLVNVRTSFDEGQDSDLEKIELLEYSLELPGGTPARRARLLGALAVELIFVGDAPRRDVVLDEARALATSSGDPVALVDTAACHFLARPRSTWSTPRFVSDRALFGQALDAAVSLGDPHTVATMQSHAASYALVAGNGEQVRAYATALSETSADGQNQIAHRARLLVAQTVATLEGRLSEAEALSAQAFEVRRMTGLADADKIRVTGQLAIRREQGRLVEIIPAFTDYVTAFPRAAAAVATVAFAVAETGHRDEAALLLVQAGRAGFGDIPDDADWPLAVAMWSEVAARVGDPDAAEALHEIMEPMDGLLMSTNDIACGPAARLLALLEIVLGRPADADRHFAEAVEFSRRLGSPVWTARCQIEWAETWLWRGERDRAAQLIDEADAAIGELSLPALEQRITAIRDRLG